MDTVRPELSARLLLNAQGLLDSPEGPADADRVLEVTRRLGYVQIDSINMVERAHHLTLLARLDEYTPALLTELLEERRALFEQWTHDASVIPTSWYHQWRPRFRRSRRRIRENRWWNSRMGPRPDLVLRAVRARVRREGPVLARDFETPDGGDRSGPWWGWKPQKAALEYLWRSGELAIAGRRRFEKLYDLSDRVHPDLHARPSPTPRDHVEWACTTALDRLVVATPAQLSRFWNAVELDAVRRWTSAALRAERVVPVELHTADGGPPRRGVALPDWRERAEAAPQAPDRMRVLSPFDPVIRDRERLSRRFDFTYRFEAFVPAAKRVHGYYTMPLLERERFVGRVAGRTDRRRDTLVIDGVWWETGIRATRRRRAALDEALHRVARLAGATSIEIG